MSKQDAYLPRSLGKCWGMRCEGASLHSAGLGWSDLGKCLNNTIVGRRGSRSNIPLQRCAVQGSGPKTLSQEGKKPHITFFSMLAFFPLGHYNEKMVLMGGGKVGAL